MTLVSVLVGPEETRYPYRTETIPRNGELLCFQNDLGAVTVRVTRVEHVITDGCLMFVRIHTEET